MGAIDRFDRRVSAAIQHWPAGWRPVFTAATFAGQPIIVLAAGLAGYTAAARRQLPQLQHAFAYAAAAFLLSTMLKLLLHRRRPGNLIITTLGIKSYSFPSGHAFGSLIFYGLFAWLDFKYLAHPWNYLTAAIICLAIIAIGLSRIYLKAHYPSDVAGGWLLGGLSLALIAWAAF